MLSKKEKASFGMLEHISCWLRTMTSSMTSWDGTCAYAATRCGSRKTYSACLRAQAFDLVVLDINLPDQTGWDVLRVARSEGRLHPEGGKLPVVVLSAVHVSPGRLSEFRPLAYLPKPFPLEALLRLAADWSRSGSCPPGWGPSPPRDRCL